MMAINQTALDMLDFPGTVLARRCRRWKTLVWFNARRGTAVRAFPESPGRETPALEAKREAHRFVRHRPDGKDNGFGAICPAVASPSIYTDITERGAPRRQINEQAPVPAQRAEPGASRCLTRSCCQGAGTTSCWMCWRADGAGNGCSIWS